MLIMHRVEVRRRGAAVVSDASLRTESPGLLFLVGPGGAGKSSLLAAMHGVEGEEAPQLDGIVELDGEALGARPRRSVRVAQHERLDAESSIGVQLSARCDASPARVASWLTKAGVPAPRAAVDRRAGELSASVRRLLAVLGGLHAQAPLYLVDEPTAGLDDAHVRLVRERLAEVSTGASVVVATHNRLDCLALGGRTALLAGGTIQECAQTASFFSAPSTAAGRQYVETGNCSVPRPLGPQERGNGIWWVVPGLLAGMSRPGMVANAAQQYRRLVDQGVGMLVCLEEQVGYPAMNVREAGLTLHHIPVPDMAPPSFAQAVDLCRLAEPAIRNNQGIALHCRGGLGRTGTGLAAVLIWFGDNPQEAIAKVRSAHALAIQSAAQSRFLHDFAERIRGWH